MLTLKIAKLFSLVFNPNACQYFIFLFFVTGTTSIALHSAAFLLLNLIPIVAYVLFVKYVLKREDLYVLERKYRFLPFAINIICVLIFGKIANAYNHNWFILMLLLNVISFIITLAWRISLHQTALSAFVTFFILLNLSNLTFSTTISFFALASLITIVGWSRSYLKAHTIPQIIGGTLLGVLTSLAYFKLYL